MAVCHIWARVGLVGELKDGCLSYLGQDRTGRRGEEILTYISYPSGINPPPPFPPKCYVVAVSIMYVLGIETYLINNTAIQVSEASLSTCMTGYKTI